MRFLIILLFPTFAFAMPQHWTPWPSNGTVYLDKELCPGECWPMVENDKIVDLEIAEITNVLIDDLSKPLHEAKSKVQSCASQKECDEIRASKVIENNVTVQYCPSSHFSVVNELAEGFEVYCTRIVGYGKMTVRKLQENPAKKAARDTRLAQEAADKKAKEDARKVLFSEIATMKNKTTLTNAERDKILLYLIKKELGE